MKFSHLLPSIFATISAMLICALPAKAQYGSQYLANLGSENFNWYMNSILIYETASPKAYERAARAKVATAYPAASLAIPTPKRLASHYPAASRPQAEKLFSEMLTSYAKVETQFGIPKGDVGGAVAALVAGSYMGMHNTDFPDSQFKNLVTQMQTALATDEAFKTSSPEQRRALYEEVAILGMTLAATQMALKRGPNPAVEANMRKTGRKYLEQLTGKNPDTLSLGAEGLSGL